MKKLLIAAAAISAALALSACAVLNTTAQKALDEAKMSMAGGDFTAALNYVELAAKEGLNSDEVNELKGILENYIKAKDEYDKANMDGAREALDKISAAYSNYSIASAVDTLKNDVANKSSVMGDADTLINTVKKQVADGDYAGATENINTLYSKELTNYQRKQVDELKTTIDTAQSKISSAENKKPDVVYVTPAPSQNTNVIATYYVVNCNEWITLRSSPSTSASSLAKIPLGQAVGYIENAGNGFYKINYDGKVGYGLAAYLSADKPSSNSYEYVEDIPEQSTSAGREHIAEVVNCNEWITLRSRPSTSAESLDKIPLGSYVRYISDADNGFWYIEYKGQYGYALKQYLVIR